MLQTFKVNNIQSDLQLYERGHLNIMKLKRGFIWRNFHWPDLSMLLI